MPDGTILFHTLQGRKAFVIRYAPKKDLKADTRRDKVFNNLTGTAWIDTNQYRIVKADGHLIYNVRIGWIAANILVANLVYEQQEIESGIWMPKTVEARITGNIFSSDH